MADLRRTVKTLADDLTAATGLKVSNRREATADLQKIVDRTGWTNYQVTPSGVMVPEGNVFPPGITHLWITTYYLRAAGSPPGSKGETLIYEGRRPMPPHLQRVPLTPAQLVTKARRLMPGRHQGKIVMVLPEYGKPALKEGEKPKTLTGKPVREADKLAESAQILGLLQDKYGQKGTAKLIGVTDRTIRGYNEYFKGAQGPRTRAPAEAVYNRLQEIKSLVL